MYESFPFEVPVAIPNKSETELHNGTSKPSAVQYLTGLKQNISPAGVLSVALYVLETY